MHQSVSFCSLVATDRVIKLFLDRNETLQVNVTLGEEILSRYNQLSDLPLNSEEAISLRGIMTRYHTLVTELDFWIVSYEKRKSSLIKQLNDIYNRVNKKPLEESREINDLL